MRKNKVRSGNCYWIFVDLSSAYVLGFQWISDNELLVDVRKHWDAKLYCNGLWSERDSFDEPFNVRYTIRKTDKWRIYVKTEITDDQVMSN